LEQTSYGGKTLQENMKGAEVAIAKVQYTERIWDRSRSQWMMKNLTCSQVDGWMRMRQISAEMSKKRRALNEAMFGYMEKTVRVKMKHKKITEAEDELEKELLQVQVAKLEYQAQEVLIKVEGAMKEVETLAQMHDSLKEHLGDITEDKFELAQIRGHIKRAMVQAIRDVREYGVIRTGDQEYLEQCGVCVTSARVEIDKYLKQEVETKTANTAFLHSFLDVFSEKYKDVNKQQAEWLGFQFEHDDSFAQQVSRVEGSQE